jgi:hypothetical protein
MKKPTTDERGGTKSWKNSLRGRASTYFVKKYDVDTRCADSVDSVKRGEEKKEIQVEAPAMTIRYKAAVM